MDIDEDGQMDTKQKHRKASFWQIWFPLGISCILFIASAVFVVILTARDTTGQFNTKWASISITYLSLPALFLALLILILLIGLIYLFARLYQILPEYLLKAREIFGLINQYTHMISERITKPVIVINSKASGWATLFKKKS
jgi:hypothetical protein